jgi:hypothetical protein
MKLFLSPDQEQIKNNLAVRKLPLTGDAAMQKLAILPAFG